MAMRTKASAFDVEVSWSSNGCPSGSSVPRHAIGAVQTGGTPVLCWLRIVSARLSRADAVGVRRSAGVSPAQAAPAARLAV